MSERDPVEPGATPEPTEPATTPPEPAGSTAAQGTDAQPLVSSAAEPPVETTPITPAPVAGAGAAAGGAAAGGATAGGAAGAPGAGTPPPPSGTPNTTAAAAGGGGSRTPLLLGIAVLVLGLIAVYLLLNQGSGSGNPEPTASPSSAAEVSATPEASASEEPTPEPATPSPTPDACAPENLALATAGQLTVGTDNPAFPPYFSIREGGNNPPWEDLGYTGDPTTGEGFESAVAYAVAEQLGFTADAVSWVVVPFANAIAPGTKDFDFVINQVSYSPERAAAVDLSAGYYDLNQAVVTLVDNPAASATSLAELKPYRFGAQVGTTSYDAIQRVIAPDQETQVYNDNTGAIAALVAKQIDAIVVDLPTADFIANAGVEIPSGDSTIVGQFTGLTGEPEHFSLSLGLGSALTPCVDQAIEALRADGTLDTLASKWLPFQDGVPVLQ
jgi:polar amino acid transport system substrate-binding protein